MWRPKTLRARFALWVALLLLTTLVAFGGFMYVMVARGLATALDDSLQISAAQAIAAVNIENNRLTIGDALPTGTFTDLRERGLTIRVLGPDGTVLQAVGRYRDLPVLPAHVAAAQARHALFATQATPGDEAGVRLYSAPLVVGDQLLGSVQVGQSLGDRNELLERLSRTLLVGGPALIAIAALGGYGLTGRALAPIDQMTRTARRISAEDLHARLGLASTDDEVGRLAATFDAMIARLEAAFQRERQFTADASHELRTPLAAMQLILSVTRAEPRTPADYQQALADLADETQRLRALTNNLLRLARNDTAGAALDEPVDLAALVTDVVDTLRPLAEAKQLEITCSLPPATTIRGDSDQLIRLFVNLLDNAIKYTDHGGIHVRGAADAAAVDVCITDTGIGIAPDQQPRIFDRLYRVDRARTAEGSGLGLAIAQQIARLHGGNLAVESQLGQGATFTVWLPRTGTSLV